MHGQISLHEKPSLAFSWNYDCAIYIGAACCCCVVDQDKSLLFHKKSFWDLDNDSILQPKSDQAAFLNQFKPCSLHRAACLPNIKSWQLLLHVHYGFSPRWWKENCNKLTTKKGEREKGEVSKLNLLWQSLFLPAHWTQARPEYEVSSGMCSLHSVGSLSKYTQRCVDADTGQVPSVIRTDIILGTGKVKYTHYK